MKNLFKAFMAQAAGISGNGAYIGEAPKGTVMPYVTIDLLGSPNDYTFTSKKKECFLKVKIHSDHTSAVEVTDMAQAFMDTFDEKVLTVLGWDFEECIETNSTCVKTDGTWNYDITFKVALSKDDS